MIIKFLYEAENELISITDYYNDVNPNIKNRFLEEFYDKIQLISISPNIFQKYKYKTRKCVMKNYPYNLIFKEHDEKIYIIAIAHQKRRLNYWIKRLKSKLFR